MVLRAREFGSPSKLSTLIGQVRDAFDAMGDATPIMVGAAYEEQNGVGVGPRVLFIPDQHGRTGPPIKMGFVCSVYHGCAVKIRAAETGDDLTRLDAVEDLTELVLDCIGTAAPGHITWGDHNEDSPTYNDAFGGEIVLTFTYRRDVRHNERRWALQPAATDTTAARPNLPPGEPPTETEIDIAVAPKE